MIRYYYRDDFELHDHALALFCERLHRLHLGGDFAPYKAVCAAEYRGRLREVSAWREAVRLEDQNSANGT
jgi:hypothetical protein